SGVASVSSSANGVMTLVKAGASSITVSDGSISNGSGLAVTVSPGTAAKLAWTHAASTGTLSSPCLFTCTRTRLGKTGNLKANVKAKRERSRRGGNAGEDPRSGQAGRGAGGRRADDRRHPHGGFHRAPGVADQARHLPVERRPRDVRGGCFTGRRLYVGDRLD